VRKDVISTKTQIIGITEINVSFGISAINVTLIQYVLVWSTTRGISTYWWHSNEYKLCTPTCLLIFIL